MRDAIYVIGLFLIFSFLAMQFPLGVVDERCVHDSGNAPFATYVTLTPETYAVYLDAARTSWQVRRDARGRPYIGRLDSDIQLLDESILPPLVNVPAAPRHSGPPIPPPEIETYSMIPPTKGVDVAAFSMRASRAERDHPPEETSERHSFGRTDMLSTDNSRILKEIMQ